MTEKKAVSGKMTIVDGSGFIFRAFHALPPMTNPEGTPINAIYGFVNMVLRLIEDDESTYFAVALDSSRKTFRSDIFPAYKANRPPLPEEMIPQLGLMRDAIEAFDLPQIELPGFEADDIIATLARRAESQGLEVVIISSDKDLMQLVDEKIALFDPMKQRPIRVAEVIEKFGVPPEKVIDVQALAGDSTDNVPGVPGIGVKTAAQLIAEYGDLETLLACASEIKQPKRRETLLTHQEEALISKQLVTLRDDAPVEVSLEQLARRALNLSKLEAFLDLHGMKSIKTRLSRQKFTTERPVIPFDKDENKAASPTLALGSEIEKNYTLVTTKEALSGWIQAATEKGFVAIDAETDGLDPMRANLVGLSLATAPGEACYIPLIHKNPPTDLLDIAPDQAKETLLSEAEALALLAPLLADDTVLKIGHNLKFDMQLLAVRGLEFAAIEDTMVLSYVLDGAAHGHGMDDLALLHLNYKTITYQDVCKTGKNKITFDYVPLDQALAYAAEDADITLRLYLFFKPRLLSERLCFVYERLDRPMIQILEKMERHGVRVDQIELRAISTEFAERMKILEEEIQTLAGKPFNVGSPKQLGDILFLDMGISGGKKTKSGAYATGVEVLEVLAPQHPIAQKVLDWRQIAKLKSTYADALVEQINPRTGRIHTSFSQTTTNTGRLSSSDPNLQNIPIRTEEGRRIRRAFIADPGFVLLSADYSQIELRLVAHVAQIKALKDAFSHDADIHAITASQIFNVPVENMDPMIRRRAKAINFGIIYGISAFGLAQQLGISNGEAKAYIDAYFTRYPEILTYMEETKAFARKSGYVTTLFGRKCFISGFTDRNPARRAFAERAAINAPIQGGAADIIKRATIRLPKALEEAGLSARILLQVHDELLLEVPEAEIEPTKLVVKQIMEGAAELAVPLLVEVGVAQNWAKAH